MERENIILRRRKKTMLTLDQKLCLIDRHESGETPQNLAKSFKIGEQTARDIIKQKEKIRKFVQNCESSEGPIKRKSMKVSSFEELDESMLRWYNENRASGIPVTSAMCIQQAKLLHEQLGLKGTFNASAGWLSRFKQRYGIAGVYSHSVAKTGCSVAAFTFQYQFQQLIQKEDYLLDQIYNADETGLYWKSIPSKIAGQEGQTTSSSGERVTVVCCTNAAGTHKLDLTVIGKTKCPWSEQSEPKTSVNYYEMKSGWASKEIFRNWFEYKWVPEVREFLASRGLPQRAILILDTSPCHITDSLLRSADGCMVVKFLPSDVANLVQPMQQGIVSLLKWNYRTDLLKQLQTETTERIKNRTMEDAMLGLEQSWAKITPLAIRNAWDKLITDTDQYVVENEIVDASSVEGMMLVDHETDLVEEVEDMDDDIEEVEEIIQFTDDIEQVEEVEQFDHVAPIEQVDVINHHQQEQEQEQEQEQHEEQNMMVNWIDVNEAAGIKTEDYVDVGVEFTEVRENAVESDDASGDEGEDRRIELQTALTSVETLLGFVDLKGLTPDDKKAFKKIKTDIRNLMKSVQARKQ
ncbi:jerky protein homolog-like [Anopheles gambiae]|uniref:HTH CENPB-type domain-containing protein n=1 Tax=Anopheles coluzzii TaxID=1518534 RepID=A0A8W7PNX9_ANOCL|nr:jerky protein homolog-like [Anopheles gambiae]